MNEDEMVRDVVLAHVPGIEVDEVMSAPVWAGSLRMADGRVFRAMYARGEAVLEMLPDATEICWQDGKRV